ncbi:MAG TPA: HAMP domain-containing sensor histidine kinase [Gemmataceae bacterium]|nr:HAMP domain-containing sensor histidine kinase [Gemmataceae bacterium]
MRSIRLSLLVYFLGLLALALGAVSFLVYRSSKETLAEKNVATRKLIERQYEDLRAKERARLDEALLADARRLVDHAHIQPDPRPGQPPFEQPQAWRRSSALGTATLVGLISAGDTPTAAWAYVGLNQLGGLPRFPSATEIKLDESDPHADDPADHRRLVTDYLEIQCGFPMLVTYRSPSLDGLWLSGIQETIPPKEYLGPEYRDVELHPGVTVRRVLFRYALQVAPPSGPLPPGGAPGDTRPRSAGGDRPFSRAGFRTWCTVLAAYGPGWSEDAIAPFRAQRDEDLANLEQRTIDSLTELRNRLLGVSLATFAAVVIGGYFLVCLGLLPLRRLGDAVSKVSERDFRLQFNESRLPSELAPIVNHLQRTLDELRRAFEREKQASADISHELRTPVAALLTTLEVALRKPRKPDEYREVLAECRESGQQISQLVERLLTLARIDAGVDRLRVETVDVSALAEQCTALVRPLAEARGLTLRLHREGEACLQGDPGKLREVLTNLLHNAIEYNRPDGRVDLTVARHNGTLCVEVRDTGVGIAAEARAHIFERFYRADPSRHAEGLHAGLGLAIVKGYVDLMGGSIAVESAEGQGSTFRVELPAN